MEANGIAYRVAVALAVFEEAGRFADRTGRKSDRSDFLRGVRAYENGYGSYRSNAIPAERAGYDFARQIGFARFAPDVGTPRAIRNAEGRAA